MGLTIITPCRRVGNLPYLYNSIRPVLPKIHVHWIVVYSKEDAAAVGVWQTRFVLRNHDERLRVTFQGTDKEGQPWNYKQYNFALDMLSVGLHAAATLNLVTAFDLEEWIYFLDDGNILHPGVVDNITGADEHAKNMVIFNVVDKPRPRDGEVIEPVILKYGGIAQLHEGQIVPQMICFRFGMLGTVRIPELSPNQFVKQLYDENNKALTWAHADAVYQNYLE